MKLSALGGLISAIFLSVLLLVAFGAAFHYWQQLQVPRIGERRKQRMRKLMRVWTIVAIGIAAIGLTGAAVYLFAPSVILIQPPEKPYVHIKSCEMSPLVAGKHPVVLLEIANGPGTSTVAFEDITFVFTRFVPEKYLRYSKSGKDQPFSVMPHQVMTYRWTGLEIVLTQEQIDDLNADNMAQLYAFARGTYTDEIGTHPFNLCFLYDRDFANHLAVCKGDIKIE